VRVLIIEDEPKLASLLRKGLTAQGFAADIASQGDEAMYMATATAYDAENSAGRE
jgi:two-component system, OmpR family, response regulator